VPNFIISLGLTGSLFGVWFWQKEHAYASLTENELASVLQWVGVGQIFTGLGVALIGFYLKQK
jgi:hypothetical protein